MKNLFLTLAILLAVTSLSFGQAPEGFKYQTVIRNSSNELLDNTSVGVRLVIQQSTIGGTAVYTETFSVTSNAYGLVNLAIGEGTTSDDFSLIEWDNGPYFIEVAIDASGGTTYDVMGTTELLSVPYALYAKSAGAFDETDPVYSGSPAAGITGGDITNWDNDDVEDADSDSTNELQNWGNLPGIPVDIADGDDVIDADADPTNELQNWGNLPGIPAGIADGDDVNDADADPTNELQNWSNLPGIPLGIADGDDVDDADADPTNELQNWGNLPGIPLDIADGDNVIDADADSTNEIQTISLSNDILTLTSGGTVDLSVYSGGLSGTANYVVKFATATTGGNSMIRDNGIGLAVGTAPNNDYMLYLYETQLTADGDGQSTLMARRTRDSQNDGTAYSRSSTNTAVKGYNYWGDMYTFGVGGFSYNDYTRTGGVLGSYQGGTYWGSLGYKNSASATFGVYAVAALGVGTGFLPTKETIGIGGGFFGDLIGSTSQGDVIGQLNKGELFAQYNSGNLYTLGKNIELVETNGEVTPVYPVSSVEATVYTKGTSQLTNGTTYITFSTEYKALLGETPVITVSPNGECNGLFIATIDENGFTVKELNQGTSKADFSWIAVANRIDNDKMDAATQLVSQPDFDRNVQQVLYSDGNLEGSAKGIWWDGKTVQFGELPKKLSTVIREEADQE